MPYQSHEIDKIEYHVTEEDGSKLLVLRRQDGSLVEFREGAPFGTYGAVWAPGITATQGVYYWNAGVLYQCLTTHVTGASFDPSKFTAFAIASDSMTVEENWHSGSTSGPSGGAAASFPIWLTGLNATVGGWWWATWNTTIAQDDTNFWTVSLIRNRAGTTATIAFFSTKTTASGGIGITQRVPVNLGGSNWNATNAILAPGDSLEVLYTPTGTPAQSAISVPYHGIQVIPS